MSAKPEVQNKRSLVELDDNGNECEINPLYSYKEIREVKR